MQTCFSSGRLKAPVIWSPSTFACGEKLLLYISSNFPVLWQPVLFEEREACMLYSTMGIRFVYAAGSLLMPPEAANRAISNNTSALCFTVIRNRLCSWHALGTMIRSESREPHLYQAAAKHKRKLSTRKKMTLIITDGFGSVRTQL